MNSLENGRYRLVRKTIHLVSKYQGGESVVSIKQRIKKKRHFFRRCWSGFADFNDAEMVADFCRLGNGVDFIRFGNFVLFEACAAGRRKS